MSSSDRSAASSVSSAGVCRVPCASGVAPGRKGKDEDRVARAVFDVAGTHWSVHYFAIFDGHGGKAAADHCVAELHLLVKAQMDNGKDLRAAFVAACWEVDEWLGRRGIMAGTTATCLFLFVARGARKPSKAYLGWIGDSMALTFDMLKRATTRTTTRHNPDNEDEVKRLEAIWRARRDRSGASADGAPRGAKPPGKTAKPKPKPSSVVVPEAEEASADVGEGSRWGELLAEAAEHDEPNNGGGRQSREDEDAREDDHERGAASDATTQPVSRISDDGEEDDMNVGLALDDSYHPSFRAGLIDQALDREAKINAALASSAEGRALKRLDTSVGRRFDVTSHAEVGPVAVRTAWIPDDVADAVDHEDSDGVDEDDAAAAGALDASQRSATKTASGRRRGASRPGSSSTSLSSNASREIVGASTAVTRSIGDWDASRAVLPEPDVVEWDLSDCLLTGGSVSVKTHPPQSSSSSSSSNNNKAPATSPVSRVRVQADDANDVSPPRVGETTTGADDAPSQPRRTPVVCQYFERVLIASDGLWDILTVRRVERLLATVRDPQTLVDALISAARKTSVDKGYSALKDDTSVLVVDIKDDGDFTTATSGVALGCACVVA